MLPPAPKLTCKSKGERWHAIAEISTFTTGNDTEGDLLFIIRQRYRRRW